MYSFFPSRGVRMSVHAFRISSSHSCGYSFRRLRLMMKWTLSPWKHSSINNPILSAESLPESRWNRSSLSVICRASRITSVRKAGVPFWQCCFPSRSSQASRYPSVPIYAKIGAYPSLHL